MNQQVYRDLLNKYCEDFGSTYSYVAKIAGVGVSHLSMWKDNKTEFSNDRLDCIIKFLRDRNIEIER